MTIEADRYRITADNIVDNKGNRLEAWVRFTHTEDWNSEGEEFALIQKFDNGRWINMKLVPDV